MFESEAGIIGHVLGGNCVAVHHIGSTAVPGLAAKPIIDIMPVVKSLADVDKMAGRFAEYGYEYLGEFGIAGRRCMRKGGVEVVSCPTCGRTRIDLIGLANQVENMVADIPLDIKVAVMGCVVNGPGEAKEADIGIAGGIGEGLLIKNGEVYKKVPEGELLEALRYELLHWNEQQK